MSSVPRAGPSRMGSSVLYMSMSLDGFITGPDDDREQGLGRDGERLHAWIDGSGGDGPGVSSLRPSGPSGTVFDELMATGAVVVGRRTFEFAGGWGGDHHGVPIFVVTHEAPEDAEPWPLVSYVTEGIGSAMAQAKDAAGSRDVLVHGAATAQTALAAGVLDELEIHLVPVLLGAGRRLFENLGTEHVELEVGRVLDARGITHLRYRVRRQGCLAGPGRWAP
jgi:dihydrofolate reductase